ncbi:universal stress protein [Streptomyces atroolivaceus]|uniref:universal stress protein n=1 Tax=Streptomyces atroolivaceus TaxID=66869 RepID=UPI002023C168|nr:universal stress protein [Streptomyces atroolivaceus]
MRPRVVAGVGGTSGSPAVLRRAAAEARLRGAELWAVLAWEAPGAGVGGRRGVSLAPSLPGCRAEAVERLRDALSTAFGTTGAGVPVVGRAVRGTPGAALVDVARDEDCVLVVGTGSRGALQRRLWPSVARYCLAHAPCPVLAVPPSPLRTELAAVRRRNVLRLRLDTRELTDLDGV